MFGLRAWRRRRFLESARLTASEWESALGRLPLLHGLSGEQALRLQALALLFLREKSLEPAGGLELQPEMALDVALLAVMPILELDFEWLDGWVSLVLYPDEFVVDHDAVDEAGVVHRIREARSGESWDLGPVVLSWEDVRQSAPLDGYNVVIHEVAHKLDARDGLTNGMPPLHRGMSPARWSEVFAAAYEELDRQERSGEEPALDPYALEAPAEFFAVATESFFECPHHLRTTLPSVYDLLRTFYRQDPAARLSPHGHWPEWPSAG